jgi:dTDP-4-amino-4,6-dideoxygalactose transaminase
MGAKIVWADIRKDNLCLDPEDVKKRITNRTKAIVNVHLGGIENDLGKMPVPVVADACQALGVFNGDYTCCSFQAIKHITTGDGGMLVCPNKETYDKAKLMRWFGIDREKKIANNWQAYTKRQMTFNIDILGYKRQMTDIAAAMGIAGLGVYDKVISHRKKLFNLYKNLLKGVDGIKIVDGSNNTCWLCTVLVEKRDDFAKKMFENEIDTNLVQIRNDAFNIFGKRVRLPVMDEVEGKYISLPLNMGVTEDDVIYIYKTIKSGW